MGATEYAWEYDVARGKPIEVALNSRAQAARQPASAEQQPTEVAMVAPSAAVPVADPPPNVPLQPSATQVTRVRQSVDHLARQKPDPPHEPPPAAVDPPPVLPEERIEETPPATAQAAPAPRADLPPDTIASLPSIALEAAPLGISADELPQKLANNPAPRYPLDALRNGIEGRVVLRVLVGSDGTVRRVKINQSSGSDSLDAAALSAVERWRFNPARLSGQKVEHEVLVPVKFTIRRV